MKKLIYRKTCNSGSVAFRHTLHPLTISLYLILGALSIAHADDAVEFNTDILDVKERSNIDLSQFSQAGYLMPGKYQMVLHVNKSEIPEQTIEFLAPENKPKDGFVE